MAEQKETIEVKKDMLQQLFDKIEAQDKRAAEQDKKLDAMAKANKAGVELAEHRLLRNPEALMREEPQFKQQEKITVVDVPATIDGAYVKDCCPYCIKVHKGQPTILDVTTGGKYACRRCGKHWFPWAIFPEDGSTGPHPYNILMERGEKEKFEEWLKIQKLEANQKVAV